VYVSYSLIRRHFKDGLQALMRERKTLYFKIGVRFHSALIIFKDLRFLLKSMRVFFPLEDMRCFNWIYLYTLYWVRLCQHDFIPNVGRIL